MPRKDWGWLTTGPLGLYTSRIILPLRLNYLGDYVSLSFCFMLECHGQKLDILWLVQLFSYHF